MYPLRGKEKHETRLCIYCNARDMIIETSICETESHLTLLIRNINRVG